MMVSIKVVSKRLKLKLLSRVQLCDPMDCSLPGSSIHGIFQARILEWVDISFSRRSSPPRDWTRVSNIVGRCFTIWATREVSKGDLCFYNCFSPWTQLLSHCSGPVIRDSWLLVSEWHPCVMRSMMEGSSSLLPSWLAFASMKSPLYELGWEQEDPVFSAYHAWRRTSVLWCEKWP